jgi:hypothetical protein
MRNLILFTSILGLASLVQADVLVTVTENTSSINGTSGSLDFQFDPGPLVTQGATVKITNFSGGAFTGAPSLTGSETGGPLPSAVTLSNATVFNDYFQGFHFGNSLTFTLDFGGAAVNAPNGMSTSTSVFTFSTYSDALGITPVLTSDPNGVALVSTVNLNGTVTTTTFSPQATVVPEPTPIGSLATAFVTFGGFRLWRRRSMRLASEREVC